MIEFDKTVRYKKPDFNRLIRTNAALLMETARYVQNVTRILTDSRESDNRPLTCHEERSCPHPTHKD